MKHGPKASGLHKRNKNRKKKVYDLAQELHIRRLNKKKALRRVREIRQEGRKTYLLYEKEGRLDELHQLQAELKAAKINPGSKVYDKDGNLIPLISNNLTSQSIPYDSRMGEMIANRIALGETLTGITKDGPKPKRKKNDTEAKKDTAPTITVIRRWYREVPEFKSLLDQAHTERVEYYLDEMFTLMDEVKTNKTGVREAQFVADQIKWFAERIHPKFLQKSKDSLNINVGDDGKVQFNITLAGPDQCIETANYAKQGGANNLPLIEITHESGDIPETV